MVKTPSSTSQPQRSARLLLVFVVLIILMVSGQTWWAVKQDKQLTLDSEVSNGMVAVRLLEEHATQTLQEAVNTLDQLAEVAQSPLYREVALGVDVDVDFEASINRVIAVTEPKLAKHLKTLRFINPQGFSLITLPDVLPQHEDLNAREYIRYLIAHQEDRTVLIGHPYPNRYDSQLVIPVARNIYAATGKWLGIVNVDLRLAYFGKVYERVAKDNNASVALIANQGYVVIRSPFEARYLDRDISASPVLPRLREGPEEGKFDDETFLDDERARLYTYRKIANFPMMTVYGRDFDTILSTWRDRTKGRVFLSGGTIVLILGMAILLQMYIARLSHSRESLRLSETKFVGLFQHTPVPLILVQQADNRIIEVNDAWLALFGYDKKSVQNRTAADLNLWRDPEQRSRMAQQLLTQDYVSQQDVLLRHRNGKEFICLLSARVFAENGQKWIIFNVVDVTEQRRIEGEIRELNFALEERVASRTKNLEVSNQSLSEALSSVNVMQAELIRTEKMVALGSLVAGVAHELNTPIGNSVMIASAVQDQTKEFARNVKDGILKRQMLDSYVENCIKGMDILLRTLQRAADLISSFKQVAVDQSGNIRRRFSLNAVLGEVWEMLGPTFKGTPYNMRLEVGDDIEFDSYPGALGQVITNFVNNSVMHGFDGRDHGTMRIFTAALDDQYVQVIFSDDGMGVSEETLKRIFDPFFTTKLGSGGSGLGMHIVYNIVVDVLGGKIQITSKPGSGMTITLTLPRIAPQKAE